jgi:hypothetical protein
MNGFDRQRLIGALVLLATALYLIAVAPGFRYRRATRLVALTVYAIAIGVVLVWIALWLIGVEPGR